MATIAANDFRRQWEDVREDALAAVDRVGQSGWLVLGEEVRAFERELATWWGASFAVGVASGLDALEIALRATGIGPGDRVLTTPLTAFATTLAILRAGAEPVWSDVDESGGLDLRQAEESLRGDPSIRALLPVHLYGHPLDPVELRRVGEENDVVVIEDCAQSVGAERGGRPTGAAGRVACTSFYPTKNLGAMGDGGALLTDDEALAGRARVLRDYGQRSRYEHVEQGLNSRLDELQAAILRSAQLPRLDRHLTRRREIAARYDEVLAETPLRPIAPAAGSSSRHLYPVEVQGDPSDVASQLIAAGVGVGRHYPFVCPDQVAVAEVSAALDELPIARRLAQREISLPVHPYLDDEEVEAVVEACRGIRA
ncbi:MAG TPA: DegT/DnrJ/EryC1/StrS family aminotransferase [Solirubrobacterales bacterium]|nr:DegT/DnrJ/EryC1/StrS family aminotransferase [Solirubrobacterales bacterium]